MIASCLRTGGFWVGFTWPPPVAPWIETWTVGFWGARKIRAAPPVISRSRLPPPVMSCATAATVIAKTKQKRGKRRVFMRKSFSFAPDYNSFRRQTQGRSLRCGERQKRCMYPGLELADALDQWTTE